MASCPNIDISENDTNYTHIPYTKLQTKHLGILYHFMNAAGFFFNLSL